MRQKAVIAVALALTACGGGSNSASPPASPATGNGGRSGAGPQVFALQGGGTLTLNGDGTVTFQQNGPAATLSPNLVGSPTISPAPGAPSTTSPAFGWPGATRFWQQTGSNTPTFVLERMGPAVGLSVSDFGAWANIDGSTGVITNGGFFAGGIASGTTVPTTGSATYNGTYIADLKVHAESTAISGGIRLNANFAQSTISSTFTSGALADHPTATGSITGPTFGAGGGSGLSSYTVTGQFYGANAAEATGAINGFAGTGGFSGSFGAKR